MTSPSAPRAERGGAPRLRLASTSPRRRILLPLLGFPVDALSVQVDERPRLGEQPRELATRLAREKATAGDTPGPDVNVGSDSVVVLDGTVLGKPADPAEARSMLEALRGRLHEVVTGVALITNDRSFSSAIATAVFMRPYSDAELEAYVASGRPLDKAGAYAIQDRDFGPVERIDGCYLNVVGLPLCEVSRGLRALGWPLPDERFEPPCRLCELGRAALER